MDIICVKHGSFLQTPNHHLNGRGCPLCKVHKTKETIREKYSLLFTIKAIRKHNNIYIYDNVEYINTKIPVEIICKKHGKFNQSIGNHLFGRGCPTCKISKGERNILSFLKDNNIKHEVQKKFEDCVNKKQLSFDFYIEQENLLIEFDGIQHFKPFGYIGGDEKLKYTIKCDKIKDEYCFDKKIRLLRIKYNELDKIENILSNYLKIII